MRINKIAFYLVITFIINVILCQLYTFYFIAELKEQKWDHVNNFSRIIIPDTFAYQNVINYSEIIQSIIFSSIKNTIGPSLLWIITFENWNLVTLLNSILMLITSIYIVKLCKLINIEQKKIIILVSIYMILPINLFHSIGALKEIPTSLFITGFIFYYLQKKYFYSLMFMTLAIIFRYQLSIVFALFIIISKFKKPFILTILFLFILSAVYPFFESKLISSTATELYRERFGSVLGIGQYVEMVRNNLYVLSTPAILIRVFQTIYEPIINFLSTFSLYENEELNVTKTMYLFSNIILVWWWMKSIINIIFKIENHLISLIASLYFTYLIFVGGYSFIHHRYISGIMPIMLILANYKYNIYQKKNY